MGLPFYGRYGENVEDAVDSSDPMWRIAKPNNKGEFEGGHLAWKDLLNSEWPLNSTQFHAKARTPYIFDVEKKRFLGFENVQSITEKVRIKCLLCLLIKVKRNCLSLCKNKKNT
jgi:GH18 family chitinase